MGVVLDAVVATMYAWGAIALGAAAVFAVDALGGARKGGSERLMDGAMGFAGGVMLSTSFFGLLQPSIDEARADFGAWCFLPAATGFLLGGLAIYGADRLLHRLGVGEGAVEAFALGEEQPAAAAARRPREAQPQQPPSGLRRRGVAGGAGGDVEEAEPYADDDKRRGRDSSWRRVVLLAAAITVHHLPEGLAVGIAVGGGSPGAGLLTLGMALQALPEGAAVSLPLRRAGLSARKAFMYGQLSGAAEPVGGLLGAVLVMWVAPLLPWALGFAAGAMVYTVVSEIIPETAEGQNKAYATGGAMVGFAMMMALDVALE